MRAFVLVFLVLLPGLVRAATWNIVQFDQRRYVPISDVAAFYHMAQPVSDSSNFRLTSPGRSIEGKAGTTEVRVNGVKYVTCFPLRAKGGAVYVSAMDVAKVIEPIMRPGKIPNTGPIRTIVLDAGHGGHDSGAVGMLGREKDYTLDVALRARALLLRSGYQVKMTRVSDVFIPLEERAGFANGFPNSLFVSVHFNKSNTFGGTGVETYALAPCGVPSMDEASLRYSDFKQNPGNACDPQNIALAAAVHSSLVKNLRVTDRGIKRARFVVIKNIRVPGVLIEGGFVSNPYDARLIASADYRQRIAQSILEAVQAYSRAVNGAAPAQPAVVAGKDESFTEASLQPSPTPAPPVGSSTSLDSTISKFDLNAQP